ncbi:integrase core domain-containing protein [Nonomuraea angiospora]|uniref:integrase core domain-containing protein n=1 Tax=Nonomuraea angiospora TaxID=46172 RepID=UPI003F4EB52B
MTTPEPVGATPARRRKLAHYGPNQLCDALALKRWQFERAKAAGLIPRPAPAGWPAPVVAELVEQAAEIEAAAGTMPDVGAHRWPDAQTARLAVFRWITRYNTIRRHSRLGQLSPINYEKTTDSLKIAA